MRVFKTVWFQRFAKRETIDDEALREAVARADRGVIDADLGGGLIKQRIGRPEAGRSGGFRTLVIFRTADRAVFAFGFAKKDRGNILPSDEARLKKAAKLTLGLSESDLNKLVTEGALIEVRYDDSETEV